jgi:aspartate carbamoyltransferase catalytic subunit
MIWGSLLRDWKKRDIISILDFTRDEIENFFLCAELMERELTTGSPQRRLESYIVGLAFFEPSTRTRMSFEVAAKRLGAKTVGFSGEAGTSIEKGESLADTIRMLDAYTDLIVMRHKYEGAALFAAQIAEAPVINGGDGKQHHPTQALIDLYTIRKLKGSIDDLRIGVLGDLRYGRAANSFILALTLFRPKSIHLISPPQLRIREETRMILEDAGIWFEETESVEGVLDMLDILYVTRVQKERFPDPSEYEKFKGAYTITRKLLETRANPELKILHPLPRVWEISYDVDDTKYQAYFLQAKLGVPVRMALLSLVLTGEC